MAPNQLTNNLMLHLNKGEYTGEIINKIHIDGSIITNTHYSLKKNDPSWHYHENLHICFVFQGVGKAETNKGVLYTKRDGSIFFYHSEERHRWITPKLVSKSANVEIGRDFLNTYNLSEEAIKNGLCKNIDCKALMLKMQQEMLRGDDKSPDTIKSLLLELVCESEKVKMKSVPYWIIILNELLQDNWNQKVTLTEMSKIVGVHPVTISKYFRKYFSCTLGEYQRKLKIQRSIDLIKSSNMSLSEIAFLCGFTDQSHFTRNFKQMTGFLPKHFQRF